jgi:ParB-like chromosome segregation protein Spo0J
MKPVQAVTIDGEIITIKSIHPVADLFPYLDGDEYSDLVASIREHGQHTAVVVHDGVLLDGRNRLRACVDAGVKPLAAEYTGDDTDSYALSVNIDRRHLSKGQRAMIAASACKESLRAVAANTGVSHQRISQARTVIQHAPELVESVISGAQSLDDAYGEARQRKQAQQTSEDEAKRAIKRLDVLKNTAPELAEQVTEERMSLREAEAALREREEERKERALKWASDDDIGCTALTKYLHDIPVETMADLWPIARIRYPDLPQQYRQAAEAAIRIAERLENLK